LSDAKCMSVNASSSADRHARAGILLIVATLFFVPVLVRATPHPDHGSTPSPVTLNRGFDSPPQKCSVTPPHEVLVQSVSLDVPKSGRVIGRSLAWDESVSDSPIDSSPDVPRGPPLTFLA
jgi:hypothetical protein